MKQEVRVGQTWASAYAHYDVVERGDGLWRIRITKSLHPEFVVGEAASVDDHVIARWTLISDAPDETPKTLGALRDAVREMSAAKRSGAVEGFIFGHGHISEDSLGNHEISAEKLLSAMGQGVLLGGAPAVFDGRKVDPARYVRQSELDAERQRANKLADKLGEARALNAQLNVAANTAIAQYHDLRSFIDSKLRAEFDRLRRKR